MKFRSTAGAPADPTWTARARSTGEILRRVSVFLRPYRGLAIATVGCALLSLAFAFAFPKFTQWIIDEIIGPRRPGSLTALCAALMGALILRDGFNSLRILVNNTFEQRVIFDMRRRVYAHLQRLPVRYFDQRASGDLMTRILEDVQAVERLLIDGTEQGSVAVLSVAGVLVILLATHPLLAAVALAPLPLLAGGALAYTLTARHRYRLQRQAATALNALILDNLLGIRSIKAFEREPHEESRFAERALELQRCNLRIMRAWALYSPGMSLAAALGTVLVLLVGGRQVLADSMSVGELIGFLFYLHLFYDPIGRLHGLNQMLQSARAAGERIFDIFDVAAEGSAPERALALPASIRGEVVFEQVTFQYASHDSPRPVLCGISLRASAGQMTALVGPTGSGKSTLVSLLPAFYEPTAGRIFIDGHDISRVRLESLRSQIAVVGQEPFLFNGTIRENILYGRLRATAAELEAAAQAANCLEFIRRIPQGFNARVGERGIRLSVGEKQRISIARALLRDAPILILDEATASVDTATERLIQQALERLLARRTSFVIAHRLSTVRHADQILVLHQGEIVERGTHSQLLGAGGLYARLAQVQNTLSIEEGFEELELETPPSACLPQPGPANGSSGRS
ncbi:MAG TPA: ABC transporter ATP-binding protein [Candidatus Paceibacterota bacterium]|nr:ABC transporter ATP-binding protein [Verrucomicrobiota bacterium]HRZ46679.1 ABC transporter ATP-binding protein [Candidatus Paceibacterota bacterium]HRZ94253.1 ABC transporter ATP-binding protein [Candidatus Paceibacterota bacterium]